MNLNYDQLLQVRRYVESKISELEGDDTSINSDEDADMEIVPRKNKRKNTPPSPEAEPAVKVSNRFALLENEPIASQTLNVNSHNNSSNSDKQINYQPKNLTRGYTQTNI